MRATSAVSFGLGPERTTPIAVVHPEELYSVIGSRIIIDGRQSYSPDNLDLTFSWAIESAPIGSTAASLVPLDGQDPSVVVLRADVLGPYKITLRVSTGFRVSTTVTSTIYVQAIQTPSLSRIEPDGHIFFRTILDGFARQLEQQALLPIYWAGLKQLVAGDLLRLFQYEYAASIRNIQPWFQRRWIQFTPEFPIISQGQVILGNHQAGSDAITQPSSIVVQGVILDATTFSLVAGSVSSASKGQRLDIFSGPNTGTYYIEDILPNLSGVRVQALNPFPAPTSELLTTNTDLLTVLDSDTVSSSGSNFLTTVPPVAPGDYVSIDSGTGIGAYRVISVLSATSLQLDRKFRTTAGSISFRVFPVRAGAYQTARRPFTDTVLIPQASADFNALGRSEVRGTGTLAGPYEIIVEARHLFESAIGKQITITTGPNTGKKIVVASLNSSATGYRISVALSPPFSSVGYSIPVITGASDRLLVLGDRAYEIASATLDANHPPTSAGGLGPVWAIKLATADAPANQRDLPWSIGSVFRSDTNIDFEELGVSPGDVLYFEVSRLDDSSKGLIPVGILGTRANKMSFSWGRAADGSVLDVDLLMLAEDLHIREAYRSAVTGEVVYSALAADILAELQSFGFQQSYWNLALRESSIITVRGFAFKVRISSVRRNSRLLVADDLVSIPVLYEFVSDVEGSTLEDGTHVYVGKDDVQVSMPRPPVELIEGTNFSIAGRRTLRGTSGSTLAGVDEIVVPGADLLRRGVTAGDVIELQTGPDVGRYAILRVLAADRAQVLGVNGNIPQTTSGALSFLIDKRIDGRFLSMATPFSPLTPAPKTLWAHTALYDNSAYIEANFGVKVGITKAQLDEFGTSQVSYLTAVRGLMYAWASNRSVLGLKTGAAIMAGMPVAEQRGVITSIEPGYSSTLGRLIIAALTDSGQPLGFENAYFYTSSADLSLPEFAGLASNPKTGRPYEVGDIVEQDAVLTNGIIIHDWISAPGWWGSGVAGELQKYHSWEILADAQQMDSRDLALVLQFALQARPAHTYPSAKLVRFLADTLTFTEDLAAEITVFLLDATALSLEAAHATDVYAASTSLRKIGIPSSGMRTLFEGRDLVTSAGSGVVTSARGGFVSSLTTIFPPFTAAITTQGVSLVRPGDVLLIMSGWNRGRYEVSSVDSDTQLTLIQVSPGLPPVSPAITEMAAGTGQFFVVERPMKNPIAEGVDLDTSGSTATSLNSNFVWDAVAVGDLLVISSGADRGVYVVDTISDTALTINGVFPSGDTGATFRIERENLRSNPLFTATDGALAAGERRIITAGDADLAGVRVNDELKITASALPFLVGVVVRVTDVVNAGAQREIWLEIPDTLPSPTSGIEFEIARRGELAGGTDGDTDQNLTINFAYDPVVTAYYKPTTLLAGGPYTLDMCIDGSPAQLDFAVDVQAAGVTTSMLVEIEDGPNIGVYGIGAVALDIVDVLDVESWPVPGAGPYNVEFLVPAAVFDVLDDTVTENSGAVNLEFLGLGAATTTTLTGTIQSVVGNSVTGLGTNFTTSLVGKLFRIDVDGILAWTKIASVQSTTALTLVGNYRGASAGPGATGEIHPYLGGVRPGDQFVFSGGTYVVAHVVAEVVTLTEDTGVNPVSSEAGEFRRRTW